MEKYLVIIEKAKDNYLAFLPDVWCCVATGSTVEETIRQMKHALQIHLGAMVNEGDDVPKAKGVSQHLSDGIFIEGEIAEKYFITEVEITVPQHA